MGKVLATVLTLQILSSIVQAQDFSFQKIASQKFLLDNISRSDTVPGVIVASPSVDAPNYYFHWIRDAALTADTVVNLYKTGDIKSEELRKIFYDYVVFSRRNQITPNLSGGLGEPKFNVDGSAYGEPWGRPQSDGPALRVIALTHFAEILLDQGQGDYVRKNLYDELTPTDSVIKADLQYLEKSWTNSCFDIWEETRGNHFYTLMVQRRAFVEGLTLARRLGDLKGAIAYGKQIKTISQNLEKFWNAKLGYIFESQNQVSVHAKVGLDTAVILAVLHGYADDHFYSPTNDKILSTALKLLEVFTPLYNINKKQASVPMVGRYAEDTYNGVGDSEGNPWFITTFAFAELCYRASQEFQDRREIVVTELNSKFFKYISPKKELKIGMILKKDSELFKGLIEDLNLKGDEFIKRALTYAGDDGSMSEEINRSTGSMQGARNLTWSHASLLNALMARHKF